MALALYKCIIIIIIIIIIKATDMACYRRVQAVVENCLLHVHMTVLSNTRLALEL